MVFRALPARRWPTYCNSSPDDLAPFQSRAVRQAAYYFPLGCVDQRQIPIEVLDSSREPSMRARLLFDGGDGFGAGAGDGVARFIVE
jgi:hypothetical protein